MYGGGDDFKRNYSAIAASRGDFWTHESWDVLPHGSSANKVKSLSPNRHL
jgi:hypothetical protein